MQEQGLACPHHQQAGTPLAQENLRQVLQRKGDEAQVPSAAQGGSAPPVEVHHLHGILQWLHVRREEISTQAVSTNRQREMKDNNAKGASVSSDAVRLKKISKNMQYVTVVHYPCPE